MALMQVNFFSTSLMRNVTYHIILPNDLPPDMLQGNEHYNREMKTLYLLHGYSGSTLDWMLGSLAQEVAGKYNLAIVMPSGENSFYLDAKGTGRAYGRYVGAEIVEYTRRVFGLSTKREDTLIGGLSMGGFGAIHTGLKYHETFGTIIGLSSALIVNSIKNKEEGFRNEIADYDYYVSVFGDLSNLENSENNPEYLIKQLIEEEKQIPSIYMACGTEDFLIEENREFYNFLTDHNVAVTYKESPGVHNWDFWNAYLEPSIKWALEDNK